MTAARATRVVVADDSDGVHGLDEPAAAIAREVGA